jgi:hypothetical protein
MRYWLRDPSQRREADIVQILYDTLSKTELQMECDWLSSSELKFFQLFSEV